MTEHSHRARIAARMVMDTAARMAEPPRIFIAGSDEVRCVQASAAVSRAYDLMAADGVPAQTAADMATAAERSGKDPVAFARHFVKLRHAARI
jgi:hypothetical protein